MSDAPLHELSRDQLSVFLYVALTPEETRALVRERRLTIPGFRSGSLGDVERCDVIADEVRADPSSARVVLDLLEKAFQSVPLARVSLGAVGAEDLLDVGGGDAALALSLWRVLSDRSATVRATALPLLDDLAAHYYGKSEDGPSPASRKGGEEEDAGARAERLATELRRAEARITEVEQAGRVRLEEERAQARETREKLQAFLKDSRARESRAVEEAARTRDEAHAARSESTRLRSEVEALRQSDAVSEAHRARGEAREALGKLGAVEARLERLREREQELLADLERERSGRAATPGPTVPFEAISAGAAPTEVGDAETWLFPVYTREFYDSIEGWDRRIQRAAFKQANLLALDHRHPSLRAIPLEGLPGYYRVRVATDVRLIYRRPERQNAIEILSLIDREDLDRYVRQAKTRD